jgi:UDP-N-acetylmuramate dehydrogenase
MPAERIADAPLAGLNTFGVAARARVLWRVSALEDLDDALARLRTESDETPIVLGGGSNLLITGDLHTPVLQVAFAGHRRVNERNGAVTVEALAGEPWDALVRWSLREGLCGLENLALIPGTVGAAPIQNIGAYGVELAECFESLEAVDLTNGQQRTFDAGACAFGYRDSLFKRPGGARWLVVSVRLRLTREPRLRLDYGDLRAELAAAGASHPSPSDVADAVSAIRRRRLPDPARLGNAGSFFKNPVLDPAAAAALRAREPQLPTWPAPPDVKVSAAWMIERCGWKGRRIGDAGVHDQHALVLVNHGAATGEQLLALARRVRDDVQARFGVALQPEPAILGPHRL